MNRSQSPSVNEKSGMFFTKSDMLSFHDKKTTVEKHIAYYRKGIEFYVSLREA